MKPTIDHISSLPFYKAPWISFIKKSRLLFIVIALLLVGSPTLAAPTAPLTLSHFASGSELEFSWSKVTGASHYRVVINGNVREGFVGERLVIPFVASQSYGWGVSACDSTGCSAFKNDSFSNASSAGLPMPQVSHYYSSNGSQLIFSWTRPTGATYFRVVINGSVREGVSGTTLSIPFVAGQSYGWGVSACNGIACSSFKNENFINPVTAPITVPPTMPGPLSFTVSGSVVFANWGPSTANQHFSYLLERDGVEILITSNTKGGAGDMIVGKSYNFRVRACSYNSMTSVSTCSAYRTAAPYTMPVVQPGLQKPTIGSIVNGTPKFSVDITTFQAAVTYSVEISEQPRAGSKLQYVNFWTKENLTKESLWENMATQLSWNSGWIQKTRNGNPDGTAVQKSASSPAVLADGKTYYWHIIAKASSGQTQSVEGRFIVSDAFAKKPFSDNYKVFSSDGILDMPIIIVEGYDPTNQYNADYYINKGFSSLVYGKRDIVIVNLQNTRTIIPSTYDPRHPSYIIDNTIDDHADLLVKIIQEINTTKAGAHPDAVIGYSMGGIVARKALKKMEAAGINHQTSIYVSYDSPHMGANVPMSIKNTINGMVSHLDSKTLGYTPQSLKDAQFYFNSPPAQEMLIASGAKFKIAQSADFPNNLARIAITSGSLMGDLQSPSAVEGETIARFTVTFKKGAFETTMNQSSFIAQRRGNQYYDNVPGSYEYPFDRALREIIDGEGTRVSVAQAAWEPNSRRITFVPTTSALAIDGLTTIPAIGTFKYSSPFDKYIAADSSSNVNCSLYQAQTARGANLIHQPNKFDTYAKFDSSQLSQLNCALNEYHKVGASIPDRSFKIIH